MNDSTELMIKGVAVVLAIVIQAGLCFGFVYVAAIIVKSVFY